MANYTTNTYEIKRKILNYANKLTHDTNNIENKGSSDKWFIHN